MLNEREYRWNISCFKIFSYFCIIPFEFNGVNLKYTTVKRLIVWFVLLMIEVFHVVLALWLMVNKILSVGQNAIPTMTLDFCVIAVAIVGIYSAIQNFIHWPEVVHLVWKSIQECDIERCDRNGAVFGYTYLEVYTMIAPFCLYPAAFVLGITYYLICIWPITKGFHMAISIVSTFIATFEVLVFECWCHFLIIIHITFMEKVEFSLKRQSKDLQQRLPVDEIRVIQDSIQMLRALEVEVNAFNWSQKSIVFIFRLVLMCCVIFCGFAAVQFFRVDWLMSGCNILAVIEGTFVFGFSYNKGFSIPRSVQSLQRSLLCRVRLNGWAQSPQRMVLKRQIRSMRNMAVLVGNFHHLLSASPTRCESRSANKGFLTIS